MIESWNERAKRWLSVSLLAIAALLLAVPASAGGRVQWTSTTVKERDSQSWRLEVAIYMSKAPDIPHVPMKFEFMPAVYYERTMLDGDKLVINKKPLTNQQALIESVDVGFLDPGSGKIENRTKFSFKVTRAHGYEAGEYKVTIRDGRNGQVVGTPTTLVFDGENEVIDRRTMVFAAKDGKKKSKMKQVNKDGEVVDDKNGDAKESGEGGENGEASESGESSGEDGAEPDPNEPPPEADPPQTVKEKPGGCGCRVPAGDGGSSPRSLWPLALGAALLLLRRRSRSE